MQDSVKFLVALALATILAVYGCYTFVTSAVQNETGVMHENITRLSNTIKEQENTISKLNEAVGKTKDGKDITRLEMYDLVSGAVINSIQSKNE